MLSSSAVSKKSDCTFKYNTKLGRHGWLRLTPAYSVKLVAEVFESELRAGGLVFDPFCGTGTTGIVAAERGEAAILYDINPFLIWFTNLKGSRFSPQDRSDLRVKFEAILESVPNSVSHQNWVPPIFNIARWWDAKTLLVLSGIRATIVEQLGEPHQAGKLGLIWVAFSRLVIETSSAAFNHVSMSFKEKPIEYGEELIVRLFSDIFESVLVSTMIDIPGLVEARYGDSRDLVGLEGVDLVVTSPPYPNRISYIRELRPYMYWLGFLGNAVEAGEIDWDAIGGTWGSATSKLLTWEPRPDNDVRGLSSIVDAIASSG